MKKMSKQTRKTGSSVSAGISVSWKAIAGAFAILAATGMTVSAFSAQNVSGAKDSLSVVAAIFPAYDWAREVIGDNTETADLTLLLDSGVDLHSYQPTVDDILTISNCDVFIYVGGESDAWVTDALSQAANEDMQVIRLMDVLKDSVKEEELVEGMQAGDDHESHEHGSGEEESDDHESAEDGEEAAEETPEYDEHVWLSLKNAKILTDAIAQALEEADPDNAEAYSENAQAYMDKLTALDEEYQKAALAGERDTILFADRFPFRYLMDDYDLNYYAAFAGCSAETEASFETILFLAGKADELELPVILTIDGSDQTIAEAVINSTNAKDQKILSMNSMQSITAGDMEDGTSYLSVMEENLEVLKEALS